MNLEKLKYIDYFKLNSEEIIVAEKLSQYIKPNPALYFKKKRYFQGIRA